MYLLSNEKAFLSRYGIDEADYSRTGLKWEELSNIFNTYLEEIPQYRFLGNYFFDCLKQVENVHSVKTLLKHPEQVIEAIIRNKIKNKGLEINVSNYKELVTGLLEVRALHLFKQDWEAIHEYIIHKWPLKVKPIAYVHEDDDKAFIRRLKEKECDIKLHEYGYGSICYQAISRLDNRTNYIEIQVRTLFQDAWSSIDNIMRDSYDVSSQILVQHLSYFNKIAGMADDMGSFLQEYLSEEQRKNNISTGNPDGRIEELQLENKEKREIFSDLTSGNGLLRRQEVGSGTEKDDQSHQEIAYIEQDNFPKVQQGVFDALKNEERGEGQKFTFSKLKQAIQGISQKNASQENQHESSDATETDKTE